MLGCGPRLCACGNDSEEVVTKKERARERERVRERANEHLGELPVPERSPGKVLVPRIIG